MSNKSLNRKRGNVCNFIYVPARSEHSPLAVKKQIPSIQEAMKKIKGTPPPE